MGAERERKIAEDLCWEIMLLVNADILKGADLLRITDVCLDACKREKANLEELMKPDGPRVLH